MLVDTQDILDARAAVHRAETAVTCVLLQIAASAMWDTTKLEAQLRAAETLLDDACIYVANLERAAGL